MYEAFTVISLRYKRFEDAVSVVTLRYFIAVDLVYLVMYCRTILLLLQMLIGDIYSFDELLISVICLLWTAALVSIMHAHVTGSLKKSLLGLSLFFR